MADQLIVSLTSKGDPAQYKDDYRANLLKVINAKVEGGEPHLIDDEQPQDAHVVDLMERLRASLAERRGGTKQPRPAAARSRKRKAA